MHVSTLTRQQQSNPTEVVARKAASQFSSMYSRIILRAAVVGVAHTMRSKVIAAAIQLPDW